jgi:DNA-binding MarR family transcriptional regulator
MTNSQNKTLRAFDRSLPMALLRAREAVMKKFIPSLRENGLSSSDNRKSVISITAPGKKLFQKIAPKSVERYDLITEKFGYGKLELLYELLDELIEKIDEQD